MLLITILSESPAGTLINVSVGDILRGMLARIPAYVYSADSEDAAMHQVTECSKDGEYYAVAWGGTTLYSQEPGDDCKILGLNAPE